MSFVEIYVHGVWGTKNREPVLTTTIHDMVCQDIKENAVSKDIVIDSINGHHDHLHVFNAIEYSNEHFSTDAIDKRRKFLLGQ